MPPGRRNQYIDCGSLLQSMWLILCLFFFLKFSEFETIIAKRRTSTKSADKKSKATSNDISLPIDILGGFCYDTFQSADWWNYVWCYKLHAKQVHVDPSTRDVESSNEMGRFEALLSTSTLHVYQSVKADCYLPDKSRYSKRTMKVHMKCCDTVTVANFRRFDTANLYEMKQRTFIASVTEPSGCNYVMQVCSEHVCSPQLAPTVKINTLLNSSVTNNIIPSVEAITPKQQLVLRERVRDMFFHAYGSYLDNAYPSGELKPISCTGGHFELIKLPVVTLIDTLDTLVVMGEYVEFRSAVNMVSKQIRSFDFDVNVSLFETTIRLLGGLLSAHLFAVDPQLAIYQHVNRSYTQLHVKRNHGQIQGFEEDTAIDEDLEELEYEDIYGDDFTKNESKQPNSVRKRLILSEHTTQFGWPWKDSAPVSCRSEPVGKEAKDSGCTATYYDNWLLTLAVDLAERLLPAFETQTGIPYGTVNLRYGVPKGETDIASTAGAGSLSVEFEILSRLTGNLKYRDAAFNASKELFRRRSIVGLLGKHINTRTGLWVESASGIGSNSDSFYEYLLKTYLLFDNSESYKMFAETYFAVKRHVQLNDWFGDVDMNNPKSRRNRVESLHCFWPGMEASLGLRDSSTQLLNAFFAVWNAHGFFPEEFDQVAWLNSMGFHGNGYYPLRPELIESTYHHYTVTGDRSWLRAGQLILESIQKYSHTKCGYASISNLVDKKQGNEMPSFFLSETCKYLYLLFDEANFIHDRSYIFSTEAHPFDTVQLPPLAHSMEYSHFNVPSESSIVQSSSINNFNYNNQSNEIVDELRPPLLPSSHVTHNDLVQFLADKKKYYSDVNVELSLTCPKRLYWDGDVSYNNLYLLKQSAVVASDIDASTKIIDKFDSITQMLDELNEIGLDTSMEQADLADLIRRTRKPAYRRESDKCYPGDQHKPTEPKKKVESAPQNIEVDSGHMGKFNVKAFQDGFIISSKLYEDSIDIFNVGQQIVFVSYYSEKLPGQQQTFISDRVSGYTYTCTVEIIDEKGELIDLTPFHIPPPSRSESSENNLKHIIFNKAKTTDSATPLTGTWQRSCSLASYGMMAPFEIIAPLVEAPADNIQLCSTLTPTTHSPSSLAARFWNWAKDTVLPSPAPTIGPPIPSPAATSTSEATEKAVNIYNNNILFGQRGTCMFEDKSLVAQSAGAKALLMANTEDFLFVMSAKKSVEDILTTAKLSSSSSSSSSSASTSNSVTIPTVMLTETDSKELLEIYSTLMSRARNNKTPFPTPIPQLKIKSTVVSMGLNTEFFGYEDYPKTRVTELIVMVLSKSDWGVVLTNAGGKEWQVYILNKFNLQDPQTINWYALSPGQQHVSTPVLFTLNPVEMYAYTIREQCPPFVSLDGGHILVYNTRT